MSSRLHCHRWGSSGPLVLCLHSSGLSGLQWRRLSEKVDSVRFLAPDLLGYGKSPPSPNGLDFRYQEDVAEVVALLDSLGEPVILLGHSYGGFIGLKATLERASQVTAMAFYEPVIWGGLASSRGCGIREITSRFDPEGYLLNRQLAGQPGWLERFIDYWNGAGAWAAMSPAARRPVIEGAEKLAAEVHEVLDDTTHHSTYSALDQPTLILHGTTSPAEVLEMKDILLSVMPNVRSAQIPGGHMNPVRNPLPVNAHFTLFLRQNP